MGSHRRRLLLLLAALPVVLVSVALAYKTGMAVLEGETRTFWQALEWASETLTTTGYGADSRWHHPLMIAFVIALQFVGVFLVYMLVPLIMLPMLEERFELRLPRKAPKHLRQHVIILRHGPAVETLIEELVDAGLPQVLIENDDGRARDLLEQWREKPKRYADVHVLNGPTLRVSFESARLDQARAIIANGGDEENAIAVLIARELGFRGKILAVAEEPHHRQPLSMAGATEVLTPRHVLGAALAARACPHLRPRVDGAGQLAPALEVAEIRIHRHSELAGRTLGEAQVGRRTGATVLGQWRQGRLDAELTADTRLAARGILVAIGETGALDKLSGLATDTSKPRTSGPFIVAGYGEVGQRVAQVLRDAGEPVVVIDKDPDLPGVDRVGDVVESSLLETLDLDHARAIVLALDSDSATLFATLVIKDRAPDLPTVARVNHASNLERIYRVGADFALSIAQVSGQILVHELTGRDTLAFDAQLKILRASAVNLADRALSAVDIRRASGCSVIAVEREGRVIHQLDSEFTFRGEDFIYVCGHRDATEKFSQLFGAPGSPKVTES
ncbi:MAG: NAD-binding protein [Acidobacteriota bacterium]